jgi:hypothetical protein
MTRRKGPTQDEAFAALERAAVAGDRCPVGSGPDANPIVGNGIVGKLCAAGRIQVDVYAHNWRVVTILEGPHKGKTTAPCPKPGAISYRSLVAKRQQPSAPRPLTREELGR